MFIPPLSFAQLADHTFDTSIEEGQVYIILQIQIRDSNQNLVGYVETDRVTIQNLQELSGILDDMSTNPENTKTIFLDDKKYQVITGTGTAKYTVDTVASMSFVTADGQSIVYANHDGIPIRAGDSIISTWTIVRPA